MRPVVLVEVQSGLSRKDDAEGEQGFEDCRRRRVKLAEVGLEGEGSVGLCTATGITLPE